MATNLPIDPERIERALALSGKRAKNAAKSRFPWLRALQSDRLLRNATEITSPSGLPNRPPSALRQQLHSLAMRLLSCLEYERLFGASWST